MKKIITVFVLGLLLVACEKMTDNIDQYLANGETIYIGKVSAVIASPGNERIVFRYLVADPRAKSVKLYWNNRKDSLEMPVPEHNPGEWLEVEIGQGANGKTITEDTHTFHWFTWDDRGNRSIVFENIATVYGPRYESRLTNRIISNVEIDDNTMIITWAPPSSEQETALELSFTDLGGNLITHLYTNEDIVIESNNMGLITYSYVLTLDNIDTNQGISYRTQYRPEPMAIDVFYTQPAPVELKAFNVALGKPTTVSDQLSSSYSGNKAVDGDRTTSSSRWVTRNNFYEEHFLEIDLEERFSVSLVKLYRDQSTETQQQQQFKIQAYISETATWLTVQEETDASEAIYIAEFPEIETNKIRYYVPAYENNRVFLYEMEVYGKKK